jgi:hypothetical protein
MPMLLVCYANLAAIDEDSAARVFESAAKISDENMPQVRREILIAKPLSLRYKREPWVI